jgi:signal transduction histidine kinase
MQRIRLFASSSTHVALAFAVLISLAIAFFSYEMQVSEAKYETIALLIRTIIGALFVIIIAFFVLGYYVTKRINYIVTTADNIMRTGDLSARIAIRNQWDDLSKLSIVLNAMLAHIERSVNNVRTVSDNIAHDLRTPLTRLRNRLEHMHTHPRETQAQWHDEWHQALTECDNLLTTFQALLRISNIESGKRSGNITCFNLAHVLHDVVEFYEPLAAEKHLQLQAELADANVLGDKDLIFQLFANVLDNAIKYSPSHAHVGITITNTNGQAEVMIHDTGPGIPDAHKKHVFRRFYRVCDARNMPGNGLGLSLVQAIVQLHHGRIQLEDAAPHGLRVRVILNASE